MTSVARMVHAMIAHAKRFIVALKKTKLDRSPYATQKKSVSSQQLRLEVGARSETGYVREENQDRMSGAQTPLGQLYIVTDGMGGHKGGAVAAELTVQALQQHIGAAQANEAVNEVLQSAFKKTNETVYQAAHSGNPETEGMGSTAVLLLTSGRVAWVAHVGDSRAYLYRNGRLRQLTTDHTLVQKMVQAKILTPEEAMVHPDANVLERAIGNKPEVEVEIQENLLLNDGEAILLCSDGLSGYVVDAEIESVLRGQATVQEIPERLVELALQKGGGDNVTVQFIQYGARQEEKRKKTESSKNPGPTRTTRLRQSSFWIAITLGVVLGVAIAAVGFHGDWFGQTKAVVQRVEELDQKLTASEAAKTVAETESESLKEQLAVVKAAKTTAEDANKRLKEQVIATEKAGKNTESETRRLKDQLTTAEAGRTTAEAGVAELTEQLGTIKKESRALEAAKKAAEDEIKKLRERLVEKEKELAEARNQLEKLTSVVKEESKPTELQATPELKTAPTAEGVAATVKAKPEKREKSEGFWEKISPF